MDGTGTSNQSHHPPQAAVAQKGNCAGTWSRPVWTPSRKSPQHTISSDTPTLVEEAAEKELESPKKSRTEQQHQDQISKLIRRIKIRKLKMLHFVLDAQREAGLLSQTSS